MCPNRRTPSSEPFVPTALHTHLWNLGQEDVKGVCCSQMLLKAQAPNGYKPLQDQGFLSSSEAIL